MDLVQTMQAERKKEMKYIYINLPRVHRHTTACLFDCPPPGPALTVVTGRHTQEDRLTHLASQA